MKDIFKRKNINLATALDWNAPKVVKRNKKDRKLLRRYARRGLKQELKGGD